MDEDSLQSQKKAISLFGGNSYSLIWEETELDLKLGQ